MTLHDDYFEYCKRYTEKYGENTIVLMEVGSFFEAYCVQNDEESVGNNIFKMSDLLNIQLTRKNKSITEVSRGNPYLAGFPSYALSKHSQTLLQNNYTVVIIRQVTPPPNPKREVTEVLSPSMQLQPNTSDNNYLIVFYWDICKDYLNVGISGVDISTGQTWVYEASSSLYNPSFAEDEAVRIIQSYQPREVVLIGSSDINEKQKDTIELILGVRYDNSKIYHLKWNVSINNYKNLKHQNEILTKAYPNTGVITPLESLHLEKLDNSRVAFVYMIQFAYEHQDTFIRYLQLPHILSHDSKCTLEHNSALQLNVISQNQQEKPLLSILNRCATAFGSRAFRERLLEPICDEKELDKRYDLINYYIKDEKYKKIHKELKGVMDLERMTRRMLLGSFSPMDWTNLHSSLNNLKSCELFDDLVDKLINSYINVLDISECAKYTIQDIKGNIFLPNIYNDVDAIKTSWQNSWDVLKTISKFIEIEGKTEGCRIESHERYGYVLQITKKRWETAKSNLSKFITFDIDSVEYSVNTSLFNAKPISSTSSVVNLHHPLIEEISNKIILASQQLQKLVTKYYKEFLTTFSVENKDLLYKLIQKVIDVDISCTCAKNAVEYHYVRPTINMNENIKNSYIEAKSLRHPILERIHDKIAYVPNDIKLSESGMLLFGMNASGKSSFMKSVGLNVLMAQAGMFVAAKDFEYKPYTHIFTRISGQDNIFKGWSTFTVEMLELRNILQRCDSNSLVLGDELCAGTESISALAIVAAGIKILSNTKKSSFIFATHLHDLSSMELIQKLDNVKIAHMHVEIDQTTGKIIYDRQLRDGSGSALYGLEVCKGLGMPSEFLEIAHSVRCNIENKPVEYVTTKKSRYNSNIIVQECKICNKPATETHHIIEQHTADKDGWLHNQQYHKNKACNLVTLCEECHMKVHKKELNIKGYVATSEGIYLDISQNDESNKKELNKNKNITIDFKNLFTYIRYSTDWYIRKTARSKWTKTDYETVIKIIENKSGYSRDLIDNETLKTFLFDPSF